MAISSPSEKRDRARIIRAMLMVLGIIVWTGVPLVAAGYLIEKASRVQISAEEQVWEPVQAAPSSITEQVGVALSWSKPIQIISPSWAGVVQSIAFKVGDSLTSGMTLAKIGGIERIGFESAEPFTRPLSLKDAGEDVSELNRLLASRNFDHGDGNKFTSSTRSGVAQLGESIGAGEGLTSFDPTWIVFLPASVKVAAVDLTIGAPAPSAGTAIVTGRSTLTTAKLISLADAKQILADDRISTPPTSVTATDTSKIMIGENELSLSKNRSEVAPESLATLEDLVVREVKATVVQSTSSGVEGWAVPNVSIYVDSNGASCILVKERLDSHAVPIKVLAVQDQTTTIMGKINHGDMLAMNPGMDPQPCS